MATTEEEIQAYVSAEIDKVMRIRYTWVFTPLALSFLLKLYMITRPTFGESLFATVADYAYPFLIGISLFYLLFWYLQTGFKDKEVLRRDLTPYRKSHSNDLSGESSVALEELKEEVDELRRTSGAYILSEEVKSKIISDTESAVLLQLLTNLEDSQNKDLAFDSIEESRDIATSRIEDELKRLIRSSSINLSAGVLIAALGIFALGSFVFPEFIGGAEVNLLSGQTNASTLLAHYAPRFSLVISIEILAFFFLRLHKSNLYEIKYYQNELTNIELKYISLRAAIQLDRNDTAHKVISNFSETERNHVLEKGQSTIELKKIELEKNQFIEVAKSLVSLSPKAK
ncbi:hypothetical protein [Pseudomonas palmensis]|uniref:hypothetical protein n=1 Tax=Pseudomonas palmensis TaxID=2815362 RepID=UPI003CEBA223